MTACVLRPTTEMFGCHDMGTATSAARLHEIARQVAQVVSLLTTHYDPYRASACGVYTSKDCLFFSPDLLQSSLGHLAQHLFFHMATTGYFYRYFSCALWVR